MLRRNSANRKNSRLLEPTGLCTEVTSKTTLMKNELHMPLKFRNLEIREHSICLIIDQFKSHLKLSLLIIPIKQLTFKIAPIDITNKQIFNEIFQLFNFLNFLSLVFLIPFLKLVNMVFVLLDV